MTTRIKLKRAIGTHNAGDTINVTRAAMAAHDIKPEDYEPIGVHPHPVASDLPESIPTPSIEAASGLEGEV